MRLRPAADASTTLGARLDVVDRPCRPSGRPGSSWHVLAEAQRLRPRDWRVAPNDARPTVEARRRDRARRGSIPLSRPETGVEPRPQLRRSRRRERLRGRRLAALHLDARSIAAEQPILAAAKRDRRPPRVSDAGVEMALLEAAANGLTLNDGQAEFVRELADLRRRGCQLALAPAGTGKTTALRVLARAWRPRAATSSRSRRRRRPRGCSATPLDVPTDTLAKALITLATRRDPGSTAAPWSMVDEAGMAGTADLAAVVAARGRRGASVRLVGDDRQLAAVGAGGVLRDLAESRRRGAASTTAMRFADPDEAAAALASATATPTALDFYARPRPRPGRRRADRDSTPRIRRGHGRSQRPASTRCCSPRRATRSPTQRARPGRPLGQRPSGRTRGAARRRNTMRARATRSSRRRNERRLAITATDWVKNGDRWTVDTVRPDGDLAVTHSRHRTARRPARRRTSPSTSSSATRQRSTPRKAARPTPATP